MADPPVRKRAQLGELGRYVSFWLAKRSWVWPALLIVLLAAVAKWLVDYAQDKYKPGERYSWQSLYASGVLNGAVVVVLGAAVTAFLTLVGELRARADRQREKRLDLFHRMRSAHVRVAHMQQILRTERDGDTYRKQMQELLPVIKDFEEVREEVRVSGNLYGAHRLRIMHGIAQIIVFLQWGVFQYKQWSKTATKESKAPNDGWLKELVDQLDKKHYSEKSRLRTSDKDWQPAGNMPTAYDSGLDRSKLVMRAHVYGSRVDPDKPDDDEPYDEPDDDAPDPGSADAVWK